MRINELEKEIGELGGVSFGIGLKCRGVTTRMDLDRKEGLLARFAYSCCLCILGSSLFDMG